MGNLPYLEGSVLWNKRERDGRWVGWVADSLAQPRHKALGSRWNQRDEM
jgi:hypothetical protein